MKPSLGILSLMVFLSFWGLSLLAFADNSVQVNFKGNLILTPPCDVFGDNGENAPVEVKFDEIAIQRINGQNYRQDFNVTLACKAGLGQNVALNLTYSGTPTGFDTSALEANQTDLGIRLYRADSGAVVPPNSVHSIKLSDNGRQILNFYAIPVIAPQGQLTAGKFLATATLSLDYP